MRQLVQILGGSAYRHRQLGRPDQDAGQAVETSSIGSDDNPAGSNGSGRDDEVVGAAPSARLADRHEELSVGPSDIEVIVDDRQRRDDVFEERATRLPALAGGNLYTDPELGDRDGSDRRLVIVGDQSVEVERGSFSLDQDVRVEQEQGQNRASPVSSSRSALTSSPHARSMRWRRRSALA